MAIFSLDGADFERLDWKLLQNGAVSLYFRREVLEGDLSWLRQHAYRVEELDARAWTDAHGMHRNLAAQLAFPSYYGMNLDALNDCLSDLEVPDAGGVAILLRHLDAFAARERDVAQGLLEVLADNARRFLLFGRRLLVLAQSDDPRIAFDPVGATPVGWNPQEWMDARRGV